MPPGGRSYCRTTGLNGNRVALDQAGGKDKVLDSYAICVLMEMQRYDSQAIHTNEFFHGPFEVVDKDAAFVVIMGLDETRRLTERARDFLFRFGDCDKILVLDAAELDLNGMPHCMKPYLVPLVFFDMLWRFAYRLAGLRNLPMLEDRRYMKKLTDY